MLKASIKRVSSHLFVMGFRCCWREVATLPSRMIGAFAAGAADRDVAASGFGMPVVVGVGQASVDAEEAVAAGERGLDDA